MRLFGDLVGGWWEYQRLLHGTREERHALEFGHPAPVCASWNEVHTRINGGGIGALELVAALVGEAHDDAGLMLVGAGPLEDLVHKHGSVLAGEIERLANQDPSFERALGGVWLAHGVLTPIAEQRLSQWITVTGAVKRSNW